MRDPWPRAERGCHSAAERLFFAAALAFFVLCDTGVLGEYGGLLPLALAATLYPPYATGLLVLIASVQDARGLTFYASYVGFVVLAVLLIVLSLIRLWQSEGRVQAESSGFRDYTYVTLLTLIVLVTGWIVGILMDLTKVLPAGRSVTQVSALSILMVGAAWAAVHTYFTEGTQHGYVKQAIRLAGAHLLMVVLWQVISGPAVSHSDFGRDQIMQAAQLSGVGGFTRYTGTFLSPNAFGLFLFYVLLLFLLISKRLPPLVFPIGIAAVVGILSLSKALLLLFAIMLLIWMGPIRALATVTFGGVLFFLLSSYLHLSWLATAFRLTSTLESSYRWRAWSAALAELPWNVWLTGGGPTFWKAFFERTINVPLSDPHNFLLSTAGSFGLMGLLLYGATAYLLVRICLDRKVQLRIRVVSGTLLALILVRDLFAVQYILNNSPFTFMFWFTVGYALVSSRASMIGSGRHSREAVIGA